MHKVIRELEAKDICQVNHGLVFSVIDFGSSDICLDAIYLFVCPLSSTVRVSRSKTRICEFTLSCALIANACKRVRY